MWRAHFGDRCEGRKPEDGTQRSDFNNGNFREVFNNITSPQFGEFAGFERLKTAFLLRVVN